MCRIFSLMLYLLLNGLVVWAQRNCGTVNYSNNVIKTFPELQSRYGATQSDLSLETKLGRLPQEIVIPVVVHVLYHNDEQHISQERINGQLEQLNQDYSGHNIDIGQVPQPFKARIADCGIRFELKAVLAKYTSREIFFAKGAGSNGAKQYDPSFDPIKFSSQQGDDAVGCNEVLNIWVGNITDNSPDQLLGYGTFPGGLCAYDGIEIYYRAFGKTDLQSYGLGRTLTHEVGHWLNLRHIWGDAQCGDDLVDDTPTQEWFNSGKPAFPHISCHNDPAGDMFMNYMDYVNDDCMIMFTLKQRDRMRSLFVEGGGRANFIAVANANRQDLAPDSASFTPVITTFKKYYRCLPVTDTCRYAFVFWTTDQRVLYYVVSAKKVSAGTWDTITTKNEFIRLDGLGSHILYEVKVKAVFKDGTESPESTPYLFILKGVNFFRHRLRLLL